MLKVLATALALAVAVSLCGGGGVSAETHHVGGDGGWGPDFNVTAWLAGRRFTVGDKIRFECDEESIVEVRDAEELATCNVTNPIRMLTDPVSHVALEEEGVRYFASGNPESCRKGLKLPVSVTVSVRDYKPPFHPDKPDEPSPPYEPYEPPYQPDEPPYPYKAPPPPPPYEPYEPPSYKAPPPPHPYPSAAARLNAVCFVLAAAAIFIYCLTI